jgi:uncharacterized membrane protein
MARRLFMFAMIFVLLASMNSPVNALTGDPMPLKPTLTISVMNPPDASVTVSAESVGSVTFHANVTVDKPPLGTVMVSLDGSTSTGWPTVVSPQSIPFTASATVEISITVVVPQATPATSVGHVVVNGLATYPGMSSSATSSATLLVNQYFGCALNATPRNGIENPQTFNLFIRNSGNGEDSFSLSILVQEALSKAGLSFSFEATKTQKLQQDTNQTVKVTVKYGPTAASGMKDFYVRAISDSAKAAGNDSAFSDVLLSIDVRPLSGTTGLSIGIVAVVIIVAVVVTLFVAKKKGKLKFGKKTKEAPKRKEPEKETKTQTSGPAKKDTKEK